MQQLRFFSCDDHAHNSDIADQMAIKLMKTFGDDMDHVAVQNPDGVGQQVKIFIVSDKFEG